MINRRFESKDEFIKSLEKLELKLNESEVAIIVEESYTGWVWTLKIFKMIILPETKQILSTLGYMQFDFISSILDLPLFYLFPPFISKFQASIFRALWFLLELPISSLCFALEMANLGHGFYECFFKLFWCPAKKLDA